MSLSFGKTTENWLDFVPKMAKTGFWKIWNWHLAQNWLFFVI